MIAKVDSIILTLIDFKDKTEDYIKQKGKGIKLLVGRSLDVYIIINILLFICIYGVFILTDIS